jgi:L-ectoine synthase
VIVRSLDEVVGTDRDVRGEGWRSRRVLLRDDHMNFSLHWTELSAGAIVDLEYRNHLEANLCIAGEGEVVDIATGKTFAITPGVMYALDKHDRHQFRAKTNTTFVCVFWPALRGDERHDEHGSYGSAD